MKKQLKVNVKTIINKRAILAVLIAFGAGIFLGRIAIKNREIIKYVLNIGIHPEDVEEIAQSVRKRLA